MSYDNINKNGRLDVFYDSLKKTAIVNLKDVSLEKLRQLMVVLQPNIVLAPGSMPKVNEAVGNPLDKVEHGLLSGRIQPFGVVSCQKQQSVLYVQMPDLEDSSVTIRELVDHVNGMLQSDKAEEIPSYAVPSVVDRCMDLKFSLYDEIEKAIRQHCYVDVIYRRGKAYESLHLLPCLLKRHADEIVKQLREIYKDQEIPSAAIEKITCAIGDRTRVQNAIKRFKNEHYPTIAVTVDLLSTGIDVPEVTKIVFMRRVKSRRYF